MTEINNTDKKAEDNEGCSIFRFLIGAGIWIWASWRIFVIYCWVAYSNKTEQALADTFSIQILWDRAFFLTLGFEPTTADQLIIGGLSIVLLLILMLLGIVKLPARD